MNKLIIWTFSAIFALSVIVLFFLLWISMPSMSWQTLLFALPLALMCICVAVITTQRNKKPLTVRFNTLYRYHGKTSEGMLILSLLTNTKEEGNAVEVPSIYDGREITVRKNLEAGDLCTMIDYTGSEPSWNEKVLTVYIPTSMQGQLK